MCIVCKAMGILNRELTRSYRVKINDEYYNRVETERVIPTLKFIL